MKTFLDSIVEHPIATFLLCIFIYQLIDRISEAIERMNKK